MTPSRFARFPGLAVCNVALTGVFFGLLQWSAFFLLQSFLASTALVWLLASSVWLLGSLVGLALPDRRGPEPWWLIASVVAYYALLWLAVLFPYEFGQLPWLLAAVAVMGLYAGRFFRFRRTALGSAKWLFFVENTGFVAGLVLTVVGLFWFGERVLILAPAAAGALCMVTLPRGARESA